MVNRKDRREKGKLGDDGYDVLGVIPQGMMNAFATMGVSGFCKDNKVESLTP